MINSRTMQVYVESMDVLNIPHRSQVCLLCMGQVFRTAPHLIEGCHVIDSRDLLTWAEPCEPSPTVDAPAKYKSISLSSLRRPQTGVHMFFLDILLTCCWPLGAADTERHNTNTRLGQHTGWCSCASQADAEYADTYSWKNTGLTGMHCMHLASLYENT